MVKIIGIMGKGGAGKDTIARMLVEACWNGILPYFDIRLDYLARPLKASVYKELIRANGRMLDPQLTLRQAIWGTQAQKEAAIFIPHGRSLMLGSNKEQPWVRDRVIPLREGVEAPWSQFHDIPIPYDVYTGRQLMQEYGDYCRAAYPGYAVEEIWDQNDSYILRHDDPHLQLLIVTDCRRKDEVEQLHKHGAVFIHVIDHTGGLSGKYGQHSSETGLDDVDQWDTALKIAPFYNDKRKGVFCTKLEFFTELRQLLKDGFFYGTSR